jgi:hypothetical protein
LAKHDVGVDDGDDPDVKGTSKERLDELRVQKIFTLKVLEVRASQTSNWEATLEEFLIALRSNLEEWYNARFAEGERTSI